MSEWWSYSPSDFLLFSARTYYRLFEIHNAALWPAPLLTLLLGVGILVLMRGEARWRGRAISATLAVLWGFVGWAFLWDRYASINWAARYAALVFGLEALMLVAIGVGRGGLSFRPRRGAKGAAGMVLFVVAVALYPILLRLLGRDWRQTETFGITPDPTAIATLGLLLLASGSGRRALMVIPMLWCVMSGATLWLLGSPEAWVPIMALLAVVVTAMTRVGPSRQERQAEDSESNSQKVSGGRE
jgi:hypothetical protein